MARRGTFGRAPRVAQSLTNTLVAIAREMQQQRDQNLMDAWKNGGNFEGGKATDERVLAHWKSRLADVSPDDPMYDTYKNAYMQYDYAIHESKMSVLHAQRKISDTQAAQFYLNWAKKVPKNSEFWRVLQRDGAQMMQRARAGARTDTRAAIEARYVKQQAAINKKYGGPADVATDVLTNLAKNGYGGTSYIIGGPDNNQSLSDFDITDPGTMMAFMEAVRPTSGPNAYVGFADPERTLYHDPFSNKPVTNEDIIKRLKDADPNFSGTLTPEYVATLLETKADGLRRSEKLAKKTGHTTDASNYRKQRAATVQQGKQIAAYPAEKQYVSLHADYEADISQPGIDPEDLIKRQQQYSSDLRELANLPALATNDMMRNSLLDEADMKGGVTLADSFTGNIQVDGTARPTSADNVFRVKRAEEMVKALQDGTGFRTQGEFNKDGIFIPTPGGKEIGVATMEQISGASPVPPRVDYVQTENGRVQIWAIGANITATAKDANGDTLDHQGSKVVGARYDVPGNDAVIAFGTGDSPEPAFTSTDTPPWDITKVKMYKTDEGWEVDMSGAVPPVGPDGRYVSGGKSNPTTGLPEGFKRDSKGGLVIDYGAALYSSDQTRAASGRNPFTDFPSLITASHVNTPDGPVELEAIGRDPLGAAQLDKDNRVAAGYKPDPNAPDGTGWSGGDPTKYNQYNAQTILSVVDLPSVGRTLFDEKAAELQDKKSKGPFAKKATVLNPGALQGEYDNQLPIDKLKKSGWAALYGATEDGSNTLIRSSATASSIDIKLGPDLKVPGMPKGPGALPKETTTTIAPAATTTVQPQTTTTHPGGGVSTTVSAPKVNPVRNPVRNGRTIL